MIGAARYDPARYDRTGPGGSRFASPLSTPRPRTVHWAGPPGRRAVGRPPGRTVTPIGREGT
eukprot:766998-Hanusia_phi.AAC.3